MAHYNQNTRIVSALRTRNHQVELKEHSINITYGLVDQIFKVLDEEDILAKQIIPCLAALSKNSENVIANIVKKQHNFVKKLKTTLKNPKMILRNYIQISQKKEQRICLLGMWVFSAKI